MEEQEEEKVQKDQEKNFEKYTRGGGGKEQGTRIKGEKEEHRGTIHTGRKRRHIWGNQSQYKKET